MTRDQAPTTDRGAAAPGEIVQFGLTLVVAGALLVAAINGVTNAAVVAGSGTVNASQNPAAELDTRIDRVPETVVVEATTERAIYLDGGDEVSASAGVDSLAEGNFSIAATAAVDTSAANATDVPRSVLSYGNGSVRLYYNDSHYRAYYDNGSANATVAVQVSAPANLTAAVVRYNGSELLLSINGTHNDSEPLTTAQDAPPLTFDWVGRIDEVRTFNASINDSTVSAYGADPIRPAPTEDRAARYMFDAGSGTTATGYFTSASADINGADWVSGVDGPTLSAGSDYELTTDPFGIEFPSSGYLAGAPIVYVDWDGAVSGPINFVDLFGLLLMVLVLGVAVSKVREVTTGV